MFSLFCAWRNGLSKQSWGWWFETPSRSLWRHWNEKSVSWKSMLISYIVVTLRSELLKKILCQQNNKPDIYLSHLFIFYFGNVSCGYWLRRVRGISVKGGLFDNHDDVIKRKHFPRYWPFVRGIHRFPVNSPHKGQWRGALMFSFICAWKDGWVNNGEAGDLRRYRAHNDVTVIRIW